MTTKKVSWTWCFLRVEGEVLNKLFELKGLEGFLAWSNKALNEFISVESDKTSKEIKIYVNYVNEGEHN